MFDEEGKTLNALIATKIQVMGLYCKEDYECEDYEDETYADENDHGDDDKNNIR